MPQAIPIQEFELVEVDKFSSTRDLAEKLSQLSKEGFQISGLMQAAMVPGATIGRVIVMGRIVALNFLDTDSGIIPGFRRTS